MYPARAYVSSCMAVPPGRVPFMNRRMATRLLLGTGLVTAGGLLAYRKYSMSSTVLAERLEGDFRRSLGSKNPPGLPLDRGVAVLQVYFEQVKYDSDPSTPEADALLFETGAYDRGHGLTYELNLGRQVIWHPPKEPSEDLIIAQIILTYRYPPAAFLRLESARSWSHDFQTIGEFFRFIRESPTYLLAVSMHPLAVELRRVDQ